MNDPDSQYMLSDVEPVPQTESLSISDQFVGILAEPSTVYENLRDAGVRPMHWLIPLIALAVIITVGMMLRTGDPQFMENVRAQQQQQMDQVVKSGKMTQEQAEEQVRGMEGVVKISMIISGAVGPAIGFFLMALVYWVGAKFIFKGDLTYASLLGVMGLSLYISVIDQLATLLLGFGLENLSVTFSPAAFMTHDPGNSLYRIMTMLDPISIWGSAVLAIGIAVVGRIDKVKSFSLVFGLWFLFLLGSAFLKIPGMGG